MVVFQCHECEQSLPLPCPHHRSVLCPPAPAGVSELALESLADCSGLRLTWSPPAGVWEQYRVLLLKGTEEMVNRTVEKTVTELSMKDLGLSPGDFDRAAVIVESGTLATAKYCDGGAGARVLL